MLIVTLEHILNKNKTIGIKYTLVAILYLLVYVMQKSIVQSLDVKFRITNKEMEFRSF